MSLDEKRRVGASKYLSFVLRHGAEKEGIAMAEDGSVAVSDLLRQKKLRGLSEQDIRKIVATCPKQRFALIEPTSKPGKAPATQAESKSSNLRIRANQGHTVKVSDDKLLQPITSAVSFPVVVHGTYSNCLASIKREGLSRMRRRHIHFAPGLLGESGVRSGMRASCDTYIYIDLAKCLEDGIPFFKSANNVILTPGIGSTGLIPPKYFSKIEMRSKST